MRRLALGAACLALATLTAACVPGRADWTRAYDGARARQDVLVQVGLGPRLPGSDASRRARDYFRAELQQAGWEVTTDRWLYRGVELENLVASRGEGPPVLLAAHYDSRARADRDASDPSAPVPGANDGASGAAVLLELARTLDVTRLRNQVWLAFLDGEDQGGLQGWPWSVGARHLAAKIDPAPEFVIVVDMVGDAQQELYWEVSSTPWLRERLWSLAAKLGYGAHFVAEEKHSIIDDHTPFLERGIPAVDIIDLDYPFWHTREDTADKVSAESLARVGRVLKRMLESAEETGSP